MLQVEARQQDELSALEPEPEDTAFANGPLCIPQPCPQNPCRLCSHSMPLVGPLLRPSVGVDQIRNQELQLYAYARIKGYQ